jgi:TfoX/Sxy family transcriptional regulator of competence genes
MKFTKSSPALVDTFAAVFPARDGAEKRQMFGYPCGFVNGNMFAGLFAEDLFLRLDDKQQKDLGALGGHPLTPMGNRPMKGYLCVPPGMQADRATLKRWIDRALAHTASLPPKVKKPGAKQGTSKKAATAAARRAAPKKH